MARCMAAATCDLSDYRLQIITKKHFRWREINASETCRIEWADDHVGLGLTKSIYQFLR